MAIDKDILKDEEKIGGFTPGYPDDETFHLAKMGKYPGDVPELELLEKPQEEVLDVANNGVSKAPMIETPADGGNVWDLFDDGASTQSPDQELDLSVPITELEDQQETEPITQPDEIIDDLSQSNIEVTDDSADLIEDIPEESDVTPLTNIEEPTPEVEIVPEEVFPDLQEGEITEEPPSALDEINFGEYKEEGAEVTEPESTFDPDKGTGTISVTDEQVDVDDELKNMISGELDRSKKRSEKRGDQPQSDQAEPAELSDEEMKELAQKFIPVEQIAAETEVIDLSKIEANHPSTFFIDENAEDIAVIETKKTVEEQELDLENFALNENSKPKKEKRKIVLPFTISKDNLILYGLGVVLFLALSYGGYYIYFESGLLDDSVPVIAHKAQEKPKEVKKEAEKVKHEVKKAEVKSPDTLKQVAENITAQVEEIPKEDPTHKVEHKSSAKEPKESKLANKHTTVSKKKNINIASVNTKASNKKHIVTSKQEEKGVYTVEIYSSPSRDDAEDWLTRLKKKNIRNAYIQSHKVRDKVWYRVRFGSYDSKEEAKKEALRIGYSQTWIDRVR